MRFLARLALLDHASRRARAAQGARSLDQLPRIQAAFASGSLSYSKVRALSRVAEPDMEPELVELAHQATAAQLERLMRRYRGALFDDARARVQERRHLSTHWDDDGSLMIRGSLPSEEGAAFLESLDLARDELMRNQASSTLDGGKITNADALLALAESALAVGVKALSGGDRHQVVVHVDIDALVSDGDAGGEGGEVTDSIPIPAETVRRLACDASVVTLVERDGVPLSVGRKTRSIPPSIARALRSRDRGCRFPGCECDRFVDAHHIDHWAHGGETSLDNLVRLCRHHHRLVHEGGFGLERRQGSLVFHRPDGRVIPEVPHAPKGSVAGTQTASVAGSGGADVIAGDCRPLSRGEPMDVDLGVFALAALHERRVGGGGAESRSP